MMPYILDLFLQALVDKMAEEFVGRLLHVSTELLIYILAFFW